MVIADVLYVMNFCYSPESHKYLLGTLLNTLNEFKNDDLNDANDK